MRFRKLGAVVAVFAALGLGGVSDASALPLSGGFSVAGAFDWVNNVSCVAAGNCPSALLGADANAIDFRDPPGDTASPGVAGLFIVISSTGDFAALAPALSSGLIQDFTYTGAGNANFANTPIAAFEIVNGITVDLLSLTLVLTSCPGGPANGCDIDGNHALKIDGTVVIHHEGHDDTEGVFNFTGNQSGGAFVFGASNASVPEPGTMLLFGLGLTGLVIGRKLKK